MDTGRIIEKARQLGISGSGNNDIERLQSIAEQMGVEIEELEGVLDSELDVIQEEGLYDTESGEVEYLDEGQQERITEEGERPARFGEEEYRKTEEDKDYYKNQGKKLDEDLDEKKKKAEEAKKTKEEAEKKRKEAKENRGSDNQAYRNANKDYKKAKKDSKKADQALKGTKRDIRNNKLNNIKSKMYQVRHPLEAAKGKIKQGAKNAVKNTAKKTGKAIGKGAAKAGKAVGKAALAAGKAIASGIAKLISLIASNPYVLLAVVIILLIVFIIILLFLVFSDGGSTSGSSGYYDPACNFNDTTVAYTSCSSSNTTNMGLSDFVKGSVYAYTKDGEFNDESLKAIMIVIKTNALSIGNYSNDNKTVTIDGCGFNYENISNIPTEALNKINEIYNTIEGLLYLPSTYKDTITNLNVDSSLVFDINSFNGTSGGYKTILQGIYNNSDLKFYDIKDNCTYYNITENDAYWWPIGSKDETSKNIYGGTPSTTYVSSVFGWRTIQGKRGYHQGIDIAAACQNNIIVATKSGVVTNVSNGCDSYGSYGSQCGGGYGNWVMIDHGDGTSSVYAHMWKDSIVVKNGDTIEQGQKIGLMGSSGSSTGCHLHFEIRLNNVRVNPLDYIDANNPRPINRFSLASVDDSGTNAAENKKAICESLLNSGFSPNAVAGMMVNIQAEGSFLTNNLEGCYEENQCCKVNGGDYGFCVHQEIRGFGNDQAYTAGVDSGAYPREKFIYDRAGYGLIQWTSSGRKAGLYDYAKKSEKSIAALSVQLGYLLIELKQPSYAITYKYITGNYSANEIAKNFCLDFESPANETTNCPNRANNYTASMLNYVNNNCS